MRASWRHHPCASVMNAPVGERVAIIPDGRFEPVQLTTRAHERCLAARPTRCWSHNESRRRRHHQLCRQSRQILRRSCSIRARRLLQSEVQSAFWWWRTCRLLWQRRPWPQYTLSFCFPYQCAIGSTGPPVRRRAQPPSAAATSCPPFVNRDSYPGLPLPSPTLLLEAPPLAHQS